MKNIRYLNSTDLNLIEELILNEKKEFKHFYKLGWNIDSMKVHFKKTNNLSIGYFNENKLFGLLIGEKILNTNNYDLEVYIMYIAESERRNKIGTSILNFIEIDKNMTNISKIYLEVSENNTKAIKFYEKNNFVFFKFRHNYYNNNNKIVNAKCYSKLI